MTSTLDSSFADTLDFTITFQMSTCTQVWRFPETGIEATYVIYDDPEPLQVYFTDVDLTNCPFELTLENLDGVAEIVTLIQPGLLEDPLDVRLVSVVEPGNILVESSDLEHVGTHVF